jgi:hypothetical protein
MSIADLKSRLADVHGIETLSMRLSGGRIMLAWGGGYYTSADAAASDAEIETAIRNAIKLPPMFLIPDKQSSSAIQPANPAVPPMSSNPASVGLSVKAMMDEHSKALAEIQAAQLEILRSNLANQRESVTNAVASVADAIARQTDEFNAILGQITNGAPE